MKKLFLTGIVVFLSFGPLSVFADTSCANYGPNYALNASGVCVISTPQTSPSAAPISIPNGQGQNLTYTPLEPIPGITSGLDVTNPANLGTIVNSVFTILFTLGALFSVLMLTLSGIRYMLSDVVTDKEKAKKRITACIYGLLLLAGTWLILHTINPQLLQFTLVPCPTGSTGCNATGSTATNTASGNGTVQLTPAQMQATGMNLSNNNACVYNNSDSQGAATCQQASSQGCLGIVNVISGSTIGDSSLQSATVCTTPQGFSQVSQAAANSSANVPTGGATP